MTPNTENLAPIVLAEFCMGCPINAMDTSLGTNEAKHMLNIVKPSVMFCDVDVYDMVKECLKELGIDAKIFTFNRRIGSSECVEDLFVKSDSELAFK